MEHFRRRRRHNIKCADTLEEQIDILRCIRGFNPETYLSKKIAILNQFFTDNQIDAVIAGISGGIDSSLTATLLSESSKTTFSPLKKIICLSIPIHGDGTTGQQESIQRAEQLANWLIEQNPKIKFLIHDLSESYEIIKDGVNSKKVSAWANGQMASVLRTPALYYHAAILQEHGYSSIVVGTTNRDEGAYLGFFGKASDAMVDLQPIADLHKSEIIELAQYLIIPIDIINATPKGDVWDGRVDEEMIGAPYWFVELFQLMLYYEIEPRFNQENMIRYNNFAKNIRAHHEKNQHKYKVGSPAHFIDIMDRIIPGGWQ